MQQTWIIDGDIDVVAGSWRDNRVTWYENTNGQGRFGPPQLITKKASGVRSVFAADINGDGYADALSASRENGKIVWYENRMVGDTNGDSKVDFTDFVRLSTNFNERNVGWEGGDFDGSGKVDFADFVLLSGSFGKSRS